MEDLDYRKEQWVTTPAGLVELSVAGHADGGVSVVAWLMPAGRRIGYLHGQPRRPQPDEEYIDTTLVDAALHIRMRAVLVQALAPSQRLAAVDQRLAQVGPLSPEAMRDLVGWQWLLAELGEAWSLGELAAAAGLTPGPAPRTGFARARMADRHEPVDLLRPIVPDQTIATSMP